VGATSITPTSPDPPGGEARTDPQRGQRTRGSYARRREEVLPIGQEWSGREERRFPIQSRVYLFDLNFGHCILTVSPS